MIKIQGKAKQNWVRDDLIEINWENYVIKYKDDRIRPKFLAPETILDTWNGKETDIQHVRYDAKTIEITAKESETQFMSYLKSLDVMTIIDYEINSSGTVINQTDTVDLTKSDNFEIEVEENLGQTSGAKYIITYRTNRTVINKGLSINLTNKINFGGNWNLYYNSPTTQGYADNFDYQYIAVRSGAVLNKYQITSDGWKQIGNTLGGLSISNSDIAVLDADTVVELSAGQTIQAYSFDGTDFTTYGSSLDTTLTGGRITALSSTVIACYFSSDSTIRTYTLAAGTWSQTGNSLAITAGTCDICSLTSSKIALIDQTSKELRDYDWSSPNWTVNDTIVTTLNGTMGIAKLDTDRVALISTTELKLKSYTLSGTWSTDSTDTTISGVDGKLCGLDSDSVNANGDVYNLGIKYYSDYDVIDYSEELPPIEVEWPDGSTKIARTIDKKGESILLYLETSDYDDFITYLKTNNSFYLNDVLINEFNYESSEIGEGLWRIRVDCIKTITKTDFDLAPNTTYTLSMNSGVIEYDSDYPYYERIRDTINVEAEWDDGSTKIMQTVKKLTYDFVYFTSDPQTFIKNIGTYDDVTLNAKVLTEIQTSVEEIAINLFKITLNGVHTLDVDSLYTFPTSGGTFVITDEVPTAHTYYTDYTSELIPIASDKNTINNQTGINVTTKGITKTALRLRFYIGQTNAFAIKQYCELFKPGWTCTWNAATVYEILNSDNIEPRLLDNSPLSNAIYEVIVDILTGVTTN